MSKRRDLYYGNLTREEWDQGQRYAEVLARKFVFRLPRWADRAALIAAAHDGLLEAAVRWKPEKARLTTYLAFAVNSQMIRQWNEQCNWHRGRRPAARFRPGERIHEAVAFSLDHELLDGDSRVMDLLPAVDDPEEATCLRLDLEAALKRLRPEERKLILERADGVSLDEIATREQMSRQAISERCVRARARLRRELEGVSL